MLRQRGVPLDLQTHYQGLFEAFGQVGKAVQQQNQAKEIPKEAVPQEEKKEPAKEEEEAGSKTGRSTESQNLNRRSGFNLRVES